jgi:hypothetical protein
VTMPSPNPDRAAADRLIEFDERLRTGSASEPVLGAQVVAAGDDEQPIEELFDCLRKLEKRWPRSARAIVEANRRESGERRVKESAGTASDSGQKLADDLRRNLAEKPATIRHVTIWQRVARWFERKAAGGKSSSANPVRNKTAATDAGTPAGIPTRMDADE